jgi:hypothetical protein
MMAIYIYITSKGCKSCMEPYEVNEKTIEVYMVEKFNSNYKMKKENGKWKIDGVCHRNSRFNHQRCWNSFTKHLF